MSEYSVTDLGAVTAYAQAVENGYTGTLEQWAMLQINAANNYNELFNQIYIKDSSAALWEQGGLSSTTGATSSSTVRVRTTDYLPDSVAKIVTNTGYYIIVYAYAQDGTFAGMLKNNYDFTSENQQTEFIVDVSTTTAFAAVCITGSFDLRALKNFRKNNGDDALKYKIVGAYGAQGTTQISPDNVSITPVGNITFYENSVGYAVDNNWISVGSDEPDSERAVLWLNSEDSTTVNVPEIDDTTTSDQDTWSSQKINSEIKNASSETINLVPSKLRNSATANGVTLTVNGDGTYSLSGTATAGARFDLYGSASDIPEWLTRGTEYYCVVYGRGNTTVSIRGYNDSFVEIARNFDALTLFTCPASGGFYLSVYIDSGVQYNETIRIVIMAKTSITDGVFNGTENIDKTDKIERMLTESNLDVNFAVASTASKVHNGITFTADGGIVTVNGTCTGLAYFDLFNNINKKNEFPFKTGKKYAIRFNEQDTTLIYKQVEYKTTSSSEIVRLYSKRNLSDTIIFTMPECYLFYIRIVCDSAGQTFDNKQIVFTIEEIPDEPNVIIVDANGGGDFNHLKDAVEFAMLKYGTKVIVKRGLYDLVAEFGKTYLDNLSGDDYGIMLGNGIELIFAPNAYVSFDYDGTNTWVIANFSPFNTANDLGFTIDGLHCTARNCRYILHDDPRPAVKDQYSYNTIKNCYFSLFSSPSYTSWVNHQIIGGGFGDSTMVVIENCIFEDHFTNVSAYSAVSYHNSTSGASNYESRIIVKDNYFWDGNRLTLEGYGAATSKSKAIITGNCFQDAVNDIIYNSSNADNIDIFRWNNQSR